MRKSGQWAYRNRHSEFQRAMGSIACIAGAHKYHISTSQGQESYPYCVRCGKTNRHAMRTRENNKEKNDAIASSR